MAFLIEILIPVTQALSDHGLGQIRSELTTRFGGVTLHANAPAEGLWEDGGSVERDRIVIVEVMAEELERDWWAEYRKKLEGMLAQDEIVVRAIPIDRL
ncbi:hypothetical protein GOZ80_08015 [Agrobacterium vitis]|uniref:DUF3240 domain-containing protein n=2 Tax=Agrobacterium vitis TaxID=373 RepID=A0ABD6GCB1_AGRVI|nr:hypothetical protein [Agrobacterium vitis]MUO79736.1 hypothetical protein [Agrobacterium vitis]MUO93775.1 hypothetical protein [Agrobacterium vitis]MUP03974.1 hypothetical protein [Agrobacterium vitis]MVA91967.1 hypothetical protein [Agrobacterium vitis]MVB01464.1 hypothetical protein [Agrobacterium vitis]